MELDWTTVALELVNFGVLMALLTRFLFKPVRRVLHERKAELERAQVEAETARSESATTKLEYEQSLQQLETEAQTVRKQAKTEGEEAARRLVEDARDEMRRARTAFDAELERARGEALTRLRPELIELAVEAGRRVLKEMHVGDLALGFARVGASRLREELGGRGTTRDGAPAHVKAHVSADADVYAVSLLLKELLGDANVEVHVDPSLVGGVKLLAEGLEVESSAGASLARWLSERGGSAGAGEVDPPAPERRPVAGVGS